MAILLFIFFTYSLGVRAEPYAVDDQEVLLSKFLPLIPVQYEIPAIIEGDTAVLATSKFSLAPGLFTEVLGIRFLLEGNQHAANMVHCAAGAYCALALGLNQFAAPIWARTSTRRLTLDPSSSTRSKMRQILSGIPQRETTTGERFLPQKVIVNSIHHPDDLLIEGTLEPKFQPSRPVTLPVQSLRSCGVLERLSLFSRRWR